MWVLWEAACCDLGSKSWFGLKFKSWKIPSLNWPTAKGAYESLSERCLYLFYRCVHRSVAPSQEEQIVGFLWGRDEFCAKQIEKSLLCFLPGNILTNHETHLTWLDMEGTQILYHLRWVLHYRWQFYHLNWCLWMKTWNLTVNSWFHVVYR